MAKKKQESVLDLPVDFGGVSIGDRTARVGVRFDRSAITLADADMAFCGHRLSGLVKLGGKNDGNGQQVMFDKDLCLEGTFDCKRISADSKQISTGLTFALKDIDIAELAKLSKGSGRLIVLNVAELPDDSDDDDADDDEELRRQPGELLSSGPWHDVELSTLFDGQPLKSMKKAGIKTVGDLSDYTAADKRLTDLDGIGPGKAQAIEDRMLQFWEDNSQYSQD